jgi:hypothetical protein
MKRLLPFLLTFLSSITLADSGSYRVEIIVFRHLFATTEATATEELRSFSRFPAVETSILATALPDDLKVLATKGTSMDGVWRRLRSSRGYRPLLYAGWEQNRTDYYPPIRIHDQQIIDRQLQSPTPIMIANLAAEDPLAAYRSTFYQLDGSVQLRRSRFLHLFLDLEYRLEIPLDAEAELNALSDLNNKYAVYKLKQNRQVRTGQFQYFDTPYFGALVLVSAIAPE